MSRSSTATASSPTCTGRACELKSRRGLDLTSFFPELAEELAAQAIEQMVLDGEIVALDAAGRPSFNALQNRAQLKTPAQIAAARRDSPVVLVCFDLLHFAGLNLRGAPYLATPPLPRAVPAALGAPAAGALLGQRRRSSTTRPLRHGFEGVVAKRIDSPYQPGKRSRAWLKIKAAQSAEFVIGGYHARQGCARSPGRAAARLLRGQGAALRRTRGLGARRRGDRRAPRAHHGTHAQGFPVRRRGRRCIGRRPGSRPQLVAEVTFSEWTPAGPLRAPVFVRLRDDLDPAGVRSPTPVVCPRSARTPRARAAAARGRLPPPRRTVRPPHPTGRRGRAHPRAARQPRQPDRSRGRRRAHPPDEPGPRLLAGGRQGQSRGHQARPAALPGAGRRASCCRTLWTARSP